MIKRLKKLTRKLKSGKKKTHSTPLFLRAYRNKEIISYWIVMIIVIYMSVLTKSFKGHYHDPHQRNVHPVPVVVKCCKKFSSWNTETRALENLDHPNIIKFYEFTIHSI